MLRLIAFCCLVALLAPAVLVSQAMPTRRTRSRESGSGAVGYNGPAVTFQGKLKVLTKNEIRIEVDADQQSIDFRVSRKTHFLKDGKPIKPADISEGVTVAVDAVRDPDQKFSALNVVVSPPKPKSPE